MEVDESGVDDIYKPVLAASVGFGAARWIASLGRQCERFGSCLALDVSSTTDYGNHLFACS